MTGRNSAAFRFMALLFTFALANCGGGGGTNYPAAVTPVITSVRCCPVWDPVAQKYIETELKAPHSTSCPVWRFPKANAQDQYTVVFSNLPNPSDLEVAVDGRELPKIPLSSSLTGVQGFHFDFSNPTSVRVNPMDATAFVIRFRNRSFNPNLQGIQLISAPVVVNVQTGGLAVNCNRYDGRDVPGGRIAFVSDRTGQREVWIMNGDPTWTGGVNLKKLSNTPSGFVSQNPVIGPPESIATKLPPGYTSYKSHAAVFYESSRSGGGDIYVAPVEGGNEGPRVWSPGADTEPSIGGNGNSEISLAWINGGKLWIATPGTSQQLTPPGLYSSPVFNPAGDKLVFARVGKLRRIASLTPPFTDTPLTNPALPNVVERRQAFSPDGSKVAFTRDNRLWVVSSSGGNEIQLGNPSTGFDDHPSFSIDGNYIVFDSGQIGGPRQIFRVPSAGGEAPTQLTTQGSNFSPVFSPYPINPSQPFASLIAFVSMRDGNREIYVMDINGGSQRNLTNNPANDDDPHWR